MEFWKTNKTKVKPIFSPVKIFNKTNTKSISKKNLTWPQAQVRYPRMRAFGDADRDGKLNMFDCKPFDKRRHGKFKQNIPIDKAKVVTLYHGTTPINAYKILNEGLKTKGTQRNFDVSKRGMAYMSVNPAIAKEYTDMYAGGRDFNRTVVLKVQVPKDEMKKIRALTDKESTYVRINERLGDNVNKRYYKNKMPLNKYTEFITDKDIPAERIRELNQKETKRMHRIYYKTKVPELGWAKVNPESPEALKNVVANSREVYEHQDANQEETIHSGWKKGNVYRHVLEGSGDILRETSKHDSGFISNSYIKEKTNRIKRQIEQEERGWGEYNREDSYDYSKENNPEKFKKLKEQWEEQPVITPLQAKAKKLNLQLLDKDFSGAKRTVDDIEETISESKLPEDIDDLPKVEIPDDL